MNKYQMKKEKARQEAIDWQNDFNNHNYSMGELHKFYNHFSTLANRYGLIKEFRENGII